MNIVLKDFRCKVTGNIYKTGTFYVGERLEELQELGYVEKEESQDMEDENGSVDEYSEWPKHVGGGYYILSNGEKIKGKDKALEAQAAISEIS